MRSRCLFCLLPALVAAAVALAQAQDLAGRVIQDSSGEPLASAELKIHKAGLRELLADLDTDRNGHFACGDLPAGDYTIDVLKPNFITTTFPIHLPNTALQIRLLRYGVMDGRVTNVRGEAVAGMVRAPYGQTIGATRITVLAKQPGSEEFRSIRDTVLDEDGHFRFFDLPPGQYELQMWYYGINEGAGMQLYPDNTNPRVFTVAGGEVYNDLNFLIAPNPEYKVSGTVALPAPGMKFALALGLPDQPILPVAIALAQEDGTFQFDKVPAGNYDLFAAGPTNGYSQFESSIGGKGDPAYGRMRIQVAGSDLTNLSVPVSPALSLSVVLRSHAGATLPAACPQSASVEVASLDPWGVLFRSTTQVGVAKEQTIRNLAPGRFRLTASGLGAGCYQTTETVVDLSKDVPQPAVVEIAEAGSIRGTLHEAVGPIVLLDVTNADVAKSQLAFPDADGHFSFDTLRPGRYRIAASKTRWAEINVAAGDPTNVELTGGAQ